MISIPGTRGPIGMRGIRLGQEKEKRERRESRGEQPKGMRNYSAVAVRLILVTPLSGEKVTLDLNTETQRSWKHCCLELSTFPTSREASWWMLHLKLYI